MHDLQAEWPSSPGRALQARIVKDSWCKTVRRHSKYSCPALGRSVEQIPGGKEAKDPIWNVAAGSQDGGSQGVLVPSLALLAEGRVQPDHGQINSLNEPVRPQGSITGTPENSHPSLPAPPTSEKLDACTI